MHIGLDPQDGADADAVNCRELANSDAAFPQIGAEGFLNRPSLRVLFILKLPAAERLPGGVEDAAPLAEAVRSKRIPCITTDLAKVKSGSCAIGVRSQPKIEILVNRNAATSSDLKFSAVFRMMITEM